MPAPVQVQAHNVEVPGYHVQHRCPTVRQCPLSGSGQQGRTYAAPDQAKICKQHTDAAQLSEGDTVRYGPHVPEFAAGD